ncbi:MAG: sulfotransferase, partial [Candidatus Omnitrophica bacterium]|nr:sulfotransferase [Candidatus Omnitrophota bacterium]
FKQRTRDQRPDRLAQDVLWKSNQELAILEKKLVRGIKPRRTPIVFICLCPRSGSTVLSQVLARTGGFNYISNTLARFWNAPYIGGILERELNVKADYARISLNSEFGISDQPMDPHEFGYFWERWFPNTLATMSNAGQLKKVDQKLLRQEIHALLSLSEQPLLIKSGLACMNIGFLAKLFPQSYFVVIKRKYPYIAQSLYKCRVRRYGRAGTWWSIKPRNYRTLMRKDCYQQIAGQIIETYRDMDEQLQTIPARKVLRLDYEEFCREPGRHIKAVFKLIKTQPPKGWQAHVPKSLTINNRRTLPLKEFQRLRAALADYAETQAS